MEENIEYSKLIIQVLWGTFSLTSSARHFTFIMLHALYIQQFLFTQKFVERNEEEVYAEQAVDTFKRH